MGSNYSSLHYSLQYLYKLKGILRLEINLKWEIILSILLIYIITVITDVPESFDHSNYSPTSALYNNVEVFIISHNED